MPGSLTLTSPAILTNGGWKICTFKALKCSCYNKDLNISNPDLKVGTEMSLVIFFKKFNKNSRGLIRSSSQMVLPRKGKLK